MFSIHLWDDIDSINMKWHFQSEIFFLLILYDYFQYVSKLEESVDIMKR